jgi:hypothetical protein
VSQHVFHVVERPACFQQSRPGFVPEIVKVQVDLPEGGTRSGVQRALLLPAGRFATMGPQHAHHPGRLRIQDLLTDLVPEDECLWWPLLTVGAGPHHAQDATKAG